uniref:Uncharacterized protein n=1 Tax=Caenorhabditis japonica TaxID=281687 RepID=A0A8R1DZC7_CAEJA
MRDKEGLEVRRWKAIAEEAKKKKIRMELEEKKNEQIYIAMGMAVSSLTLEDFILPPEVIDAADQPESLNGQHIISALVTFTRNFKALIEPPLTKKNIFADPSRFAAYLSNVSSNTAYLRPEAKFKKFVNN